ncbi:hypothetical protein P3X46_003597 [Hevea brasiliensis]|uniref:Uncharacterized protein n=1 Tax=Hevea brasiliensis TaxID=3981 RepID=A0ABQ9N7G8_HEVBR|nr:hypothetical protein P3X46_003597 [Hevea brasiliensis]
MPSGVLYVVYATAFSPRVPPVSKFKFSVLAMQPIFNVNYLKVTPQVKVPWLDALFVCLRRILKRHRSKSILHEKGSVKKVSSRSKRAQGTSFLHLHEDSLDNSQQISRFEILTNLQKDERLVQIENIPQLKLAPPAVYHEKVKKRT